MPEHEIIARKCIKGHKKPQHKAKLFARSLSDGQILGMLHGAKRSRDVAETIRREAAKRNIYRIAYPTTQTDFYEHIEDAWFNARTCSSKVEFKRNFARHCRYLTESFLQSAAFPNEGTSRVYLGQFFFGVWKIGMSEAPTKRLKNVASPFLSKKSESKIKEIISFDFYDARNVERMLIGFAQPAKINEMKTYLRNPERDYIEGIYEFAYLNRDIVNEAINETIMAFRWNIAFINDVDPDFDVEHIHFDIDQLENLRAELLKVL